MITSCQGALTTEQLAFLSGLLARGQAIVYPTETLYGIGCDAANASAVALVYQVKGRSATKPLPLVAADRAMVEQYCDLAPVPGALLSFWPGPLTLLLRAKRPLAPPLLDKEGRVAIRVSNHPAPCALCLALGRPITATSANFQGQSPAHRAEDLDTDLLRSVGAVCHAPPQPAGGLPSTIVSVTKEGTVRVHREGAVSRARLLAAGLLLA